MQSFQSLLLDFINRHPLMIIGFILVLWSSVGNLSTKKVKVSTNQNMGMMILLAGLALIFTDLYRNNALNWGKPAIVHAEANKDKPDESIELKRKVENYFAAFASHDFDRVRNFLPNIMDKYFDESKITMLHLSRRLKREWKKIKAETFEIQWDTWKYKKGENAAQHIVNFSVLHNLTPDAGEAKSDTRKLEFHFDSNLKITQIDTGIE
jgi:hypothetical protein